MGANSADVVGTVPLYGFASEGADSAVFVLIVTDSCTDTGSMGRYVRIICQWCPRKLDHRLGIPWALKTITPVRLFLTGGANTKLAADSAPGRGGADIARPVLAAAAL